MALDVTLQPSNDDRYRPYDTEAIDVGQFHALRIHDDENAGYVSIHFYGLTQVNALITDLWAVRRQLTERLAREAVEGAS